MKKSRSFLSATALGSFTAAAALLVGLSGAQAQAPSPGPALSGAGSFPGSFIVPGTNTSLHIGGVISLDMQYDTTEFDGGVSPGAHDNEYPAATGVQGAGAAFSSTGNNSHGVFRMTDQTSRPNFETRTPTPYGELKTYIEIDFAGSVSIGGVGSANPAAGPSPAGPGPTAGTPCCSNTSVARLKQAYGTLGPWLFGMTNSLFSDLDAWPDSLNGGGDAGGYDFNGTRYNPQIRYTYLLPNGISLAAAIETVTTGALVVSSVNGALTSGMNVVSTPLDGFQGPTSNFTGAASGTQNGSYGSCGTATASVFIANCSATTYNNFDEPGMSQKIPAFIGSARIDQPWGHTSFHFVVAEARLQNQITTSSPAAGSPFGLGPGFMQGDHLSKWGYQLQESGHLNTIGRDKLTWMLNYGRGAGQFNDSLAELGSQWEETLVCSVGGNPYTNTWTHNWDCSEPRTMGITLGYSHAWTDEWRSGISAGIDEVSKPSAAGLWLQPGGIRNAAGGFVGAAAGAAASGQTLGTNSGQTSALALIEKRHLSANASIMWSPLPAVQFGAEFQWYHRVVQSGASGSHERIETQALFKF
ncbi:MAG TPA: porin [Stellaceae bacterium]|nr:porin [Stellaceae bacterium]